MKKTNLGLPFVAMLTLVLTFAVLPVPAAAQANLNVLYNFQSGSDGGGPVGLPVVNSTGTDIYGAFNYAGNGNCLPRGCGGVYEVPATGGESVIYAFNPAPDGNLPSGGLIADNKGCLYGATGRGGVYGGGTVYELCRPSFEWTEFIRHSFGGSGDGASPTGELTLDARFNLYGVTTGGGQYGGGIVFELSPPTFIEDPLYSFPAGSNPVGRLVFANGSLYGVTTTGGAFGYGQVYVLSGGTLTTLYSFTGGTDGGNPIAGVFMDASGNLWGTASSGGNGNSAGTAFELISNGSGGFTFSLLVTFPGGVEPSNPDSPLTPDGRGNFLGTTQFGGGGSGCNLELYCGTLYQLQPNGMGGWNLNTMARFNGSSGGDPQGVVFLNNTVYGNAFGVDAADNYGAVYSDVVN